MPTVFRDAVFASLSDGFADWPPNLPGRLPRIGGAAEIEPLPTQPQVRRENGGGEKANSRSGVGPVGKWNFPPGLVVGHSMDLSARGGKGDRWGSSQECLSFPVEHLRFSREATCDPRVCCVHFMAKRQLPDSGRGKEKAVSSSSRTDQVEPSKEISSRATYVTETKWVQVQWFTADLLPQNAVTFGARAGAVR